MNKKLLLTLLGTAIALTTGACVATKSARQETANRIAAPAFMIDRQLQAGQFTLTLYERIHDRGGNAQIYIEGDSVDDTDDTANILKDTFNVASPINPLALRLAAHDKAQNVVYIARPCQYSNRQKVWKEVPGENETCDPKYTAAERFTPEVISSYNAALDEIKQRWDIRKFDLYGHGGGGTIATLLASQRSDISSLTTVAANLDTVVYNDIMKQASPRTFQPLSEATLNPRSIVRDIAHIPQYHYVGGADTQTPPALLHSFFAAMGSSKCARYKIIHENTHREGWVDKWPSILADKPKCGQF